VDLVSFSLGLLSGVVLVLVVLTIWRSRLSQGGLPAEALRATLRDVRKGGVICLGGFGDEGDDLLLAVDSYARCARGGDDWHELEGRYRDRLVGVEWREAGASLKVVAYRLRRVVPEEAGLDPEALFQAERVPGSTVAVRGVSYRLAGSGPALRHPGGHSAGVPLRTWDLVAEEQQGFVRIEREGDGPLSVSLGRSIAADAVEIRRMKGDA
jgi:hypothetical protein